MSALLANDANGGGREDIDLLAEAVTQLLMRERSAEINAMLGTVKLERDHVRSELHRLVRERLALGTSGPEQTRLFRDGEPASWTDRAERIIRPTKHQHSVLDIMFYMPQGMKPRALYEALVARNMIEPQANNQVARVMSIVRNMEQHGWLQKAGQRGAITLHITEKGREVLGRERLQDPAMP